MGSPETITQLPIGAPLTGTEVAPFVQSGITVQISANQISAFTGGGGGSGTVTEVQGINANGFAFSISNPTTAAHITLSTTINGFLQGNGTAIGAASVVGSGISLVTANAVTGSGSTAVFSTSPVVSGLTVTGSFTATGLVTNADLVNDAVTIAGHSVALGASQALAAADLSNGTTGSGSVVLAGTPTLITPIIGVATGTSLTLGTVSATTGLLKLANSASAFLTTIEAGNAVAARTYVWPTDFGAAGTILTDAAGNGVLSWTAGGGAGPGTVTAVSLATANGFAGTVATPNTTPVITIETSVTGILEGNGTAVAAASVTGTGSVVLDSSPTIDAPVITGHPTVESVVATGATGTGKFVFDGTPTLVTPVLGVATGTSLSLGAVSTTTGSLFLANASSASLVTIQSGNNTAPWTFKLPTDPGTSTFVLSTDGSGNTSWATPAVGSGGGTVTAVSVVTVNGFAGTVANPTSTPNISITTTVTGILQGNGTTISAATTTGSGAVVRATSPVLVTPNIGAATATTINGATFPVTITLTGDVTGVGTTSIGTTIAANAVTDAKLRQSSGLSVIGRSASSAGNVADIIGTAGQVLQVNAAGTALGFGILQPAGGGTGQSNLLAHTVVVGAGTSSVTEVGPGAAGTFFTGQGATVDPLFTATPVLGVNGTTLGTLSFANNTGGGAFAVIANRGATVAYNFNLPATAGTAGQVLTSQGGGTTPMTWSAAAGNITNSGTNLVGGYPVWTTTFNTTLDGQGMLNAIGYGAFNNGTNATTTRVAIQNALNTGKKVYLPAGTYLIDAPLLVPSNGGLIGDGMINTIIQANYTSGDAITVGDGNYWVNIYYLTVTRTVLGTSGSGINFAGSAPGGGSDHGALYQVRTFNHNIGLTLGGASFGFADQVYSIANRSHGVKIIGTASQSMQWQLSNILSAANGGDGFNVAGAGSTPCGQWRSLSTDSNSGYGFNCTGAAGLRVSDSFFGNDPTGEVNVDTSPADGSHVFTNVYCEGAINTTPWQFTANCLSDVHLDNCTSTTGAAGNGLVSAAPLTMITNGHFTAQAGFGASTGNGIVITGARGSVVGATALGFGGTGNIVASSITAVSIHACRAAGLIVTGGTGTVSNVGNY